MFAVSVSSVKCCQKMLFVDRKMMENVHVIASVPLGSAVLQGHADMKGTSCCNECGAIEYCYFSGDKTKFSDTGIAAAVCRQRFHCEVLHKYALCRKEYVHLTAAFTLGSDVLQGHADMKGT